MDASGIRLRESPRIEIAGRARLQLGSTAARIDASLLDLSATGMGLATGVTAPKPVAGEPCAFDFALGGVRVEGRGVVIWSRRARPDRGDAPNVGVLFQQLEGAGENEVAAIVEQGLASTRRPSVAARAIFAPVTKLAVEPATVQVSAPASASASVAIADATPIPRSAPIADSAAIGVTVPIPQSEPVEATPSVAVAPALAPRAETASAAAAAPEPTRRRLWVGLAGAAVVVAALLMLLPLGGDRAVAPTDASPSVPASESALPPAVEAKVQEPARVQPSAPVEAAARPVSVSRPAEARPAASSEGPATMPDSLAAAPETNAAAPAPAVAPDAAPDTVPRAAAPAARARRLLAIEPATSGGGEVVVLHGDAPFREQDVFAALIGPDPPRYLLRLSGIERQWRPPELEVGSPLVQRVRTGLHSTPRGPELHIVIDLSTRAVDHSFEVEGEVLRVHLRPRTP